MKIRLTAMYALPYFLYTLFFLFCTNLPWAQTDYSSYIGEVQITEVMPINTGGYLDEDKEASDWLEIFNGSSKSINLKDWHLTDTLDNPGLWNFPSVNLPSGGYLVVFASGKNRTATTKPLHTNFKLADDGEYLALIAPDGKTIVHQYSPKFPDMTKTRPGYSYGISTKQVTLVNPNAPAKIYIPSDDSQGDSWRQVSYDDSKWSSVNLGVGYGSSPGGFTVLNYSSSIPLDTLSAADSVLADKSLQVRVVTENVPFINYLDNQADGVFTANNRPFPGSSFNADADDFIIYTTAKLVIAQNGTYTFGVNSDDGARLKIDGKEIISMPNPQSATTGLGKMDLTSGIHSIELVYYERGGGAELELFAANGSFTEFNSQFKLIGDTQNGGLSLEGFGALINQDISSVLQGKNSSLYVRIPFEFSDVDTDYILRMQVKYNDGFVAYLNGTEVARRNASDTLAWNSIATEIRNSEQTAAPESLDIPLSSGVLQKGTNILAVQGINKTANDKDFLFDITAQLIGTKSSTYRYFEKPSPGTENIDGVLGFTGDTKFSVDRGFYDKPVDVAITCDISDAEIRYTTNGSVPTKEKGILYKNPIHITTTTCLRASAFKEDFAPSVPDTQTYIYLSDVIKQTRPKTLANSWSGDFDMDQTVVTDPLYASTIKDDLKTIPTLSIVMENDDLFGNRAGIYSHAEAKGPAWERAASTEWISPDGKGFHINNGIKMQGGYGRTSGNKHSFRLMFKDDYGASKLNYPVFGENAIKSFDTLTLRANYNYTWSAGEGGFGNTSGKADYIRDEFARRLQLGTGNPSGHGTYVHLYLNGLYWGLYNLCERPDESFAESYLGGNKDDYDIISSGSLNVRQTQIVAGNKTAWNEIFKMVETLDFKNSDNYKKILEYVDVDNIIDYMLVIYFTGNRDAPTVIGGGGTPWNFYTARHRVPGAGLKAICWDSEWTIEGNTVNSVILHDGQENPARILQRLKANPEFLLRIADHVQKNFFNGGIFSSDKARATYKEIADFIDRAIVGESARWGDGSGRPAKTRDKNWVPERDRILNDYLVKRTDIVLSQLIKAKFYPSIGAPVFNQNGGEVDPGFALTMSNQSTGGSSSTITMPLIPVDSDWKYDQSGKDLGTAWSQANFDDSLWQSGKGLLYVETADLDAPKNTLLKVGKSTYYFRQKITLPENFDFTKSTFNYRVMLDDGAVLYINGKEVTRIRMPEGAIQYSTLASTNVGDAAWEGSFDLSGIFFKTGENIIAVELHQSNLSSSDIVFGMELNAIVPNDPSNPSENQIPIYYTLDGSDPRLSGGKINTASTKTYKTEIPIMQEVIVKARAYDGKIWSALTEANFQLKASATGNELLKKNLQVTELMYDPADGSGYEFIELHNASSEALSLSNLAFTAGIQYEFPFGTQISPNGYLLVTPLQTKEEINTFRTYYKIDDSTPIIGPYIGKFSNQGEAVEITNTTDKEVILSFEFNNARGWPIAASGSGHSMVPTEIGMKKQDKGSLSYGGNWRDSYAIKGSPGKTDPALFESVVINEFLANTSNPLLSTLDQGSNDWIELYNKTSSTISLNGWYLSNDVTNLKKWAIPAVEIPGKGFVSFDEKTGFNNPFGSGFGLNKDGDTLYLSYLPGTTGNDRIVDAVRFKAQEKDVSLGRYPDGYAYFAPMNPSRDHDNTTNIVYSVIEEFMYAPKKEATSSEDADQDPLEFIEICNPTAAPLALWNADGAYILSGGVEFTFPANTTIPPKGSLVVTGCDPNDAAQKNQFFTYYGLTANTVPITGPFKGKLSNGGERIVLEKPQALIPGSKDIAWVIVDEVIYFNNDPWSKDAHETGKSLQRKSLQLSGNDPANWSATEPKIGSFVFNTPVSDWMVY